MTTLGVGSRLGRYEVRGKIGAGGMAEVYLAEDTELGRRVGHVAPEQLNITTVGGWLDQILGPVRR